MKIAINGRFLSQEMTGVQRVAYNFTKELTHIFPDTTVYSPADIIKNDIHSTIINSKKPYSIFWEQMALPKTAFKENDLLLSFGNVAPLSKLHKQGVMIHDLAFLRHPEWFSTGFYWYYKTLIPIIAKKSKFLMTVSESSKREIVKLLKVPAEKVLVLPLWLNDNFQKEIYIKNDDRESYILSVASLDPRKNYSALLHGFVGMEKKEISLYAVGGGSKVFAQEPELNAFRQRSDVNFLGRCNDDELISLYKKAMFYSSMSFYEGFGLPLLEAMSCGCPLLLSDISAYRETAGDAALYADPHNAQDIREKMLEMTNNANLRQELSQKGLERAKSFDKAVTIEKLSNYLKNL